MTVGLQFRPQTQAYFSFELNNLLYVDSHMGQLVPWFGDPGYKQMSADGRAQYLIYWHFSASYICTNNGFETKIGP